MGNLAWIIGFVCFILYYLGSSGEPRTVKRIFLKPGFLLPILAYMLAWAIYVIGS